MFNQIASFFIGIATAVSSFLGFTPSYGSLTTLNGTDRLTDSRAVINANFTDLDTRKLETTATTLPSSFINSSLVSSSLTSVGTLTTGTWNATTIATTKGGTGSTTLASNQVLIGNGTGNIGVVSGLGTSGQSLVSNGVGTAPTWQSVGVNQSDNYAWTGTHSFSQGLLATASSTFTATTTISASSVTNNALVVNTVPHSFPSSGIASSTTWAFDANGKATYWALPTYTNGSFATTTDSGSAGTTAYAHGLGRIPKKVKITANYLDNTQSLEQSFGVYNGTTISTAWSSLLFENGAQRNTSGVSSTYILYLSESNSGGTQEIRATITWDATNFYLTWSTSANFLASYPTNVMWEAE
jgi:hypothetical protein